MIDVVERRQHKLIALSRPSDQKPITGKLLCKGLPPTNVIRKSDLLSLLLPKESPENSETSRSCQPYNLHRASAEEIGPQVELLERLKGVPLIRKK